jgi:hypothetical protein
MRLADAGYIRSTWKKWPDKKEAEGQAGGGRPDPRQGLGNTACPNRVPSLYTKKLKDQVEFSDLVQSSCVKPVKRCRPCPLSHCNRRSCAVVKELAAWDLPLVQPREKLMPARDRTLSFPGTQSPTRSSHFNLRKSIWLAAGSAYCPTGCVARGFQKASPLPGHPLLSARRLSFAAKDWATDRKCAACCYILRMKAAIAVTATSMEKVNSSQNRTHLAPHS